MGKRRERRMRYILAIKRILEGGEMLTSHALSIKVGLTKHELAGMLRGEEGIVRTMINRVPYYSKPTNAFVGGGYCLVSGSETESEVVGNQK